MIKHLVISGGGHTMIQQLGAISYLCQNSYINLNNIESIYATSAGAFVAVLLTLEYDWETMIDYIIKRPWHEVFRVDIEKILAIYENKGLFNQTIIQSFMKPLFNAKDISLDIDLEDFYKLFRKELHFYSVDINKNMVVDISYITYPKLKLLTALQMTSAIPIFVEPVCTENGECFIDAGYICNYPLQQALNSGKNPEEILGLKNNYIGVKTEITQQSSLVDFLSVFCFNTVFGLSKDHLQPIIPNEIVMNTEPLSLELLQNVFSSIERRKDLLNNGIVIAKTYLEKITYLIMEANKI